MIRLCFAAQSCFLLGIALIQCGIHHASPSEKEKAQQLNREGLALFQSNRLAGACGKFRDAAFFDPENAEHYNNLGMCESERGHMETAQEAFAKAIRFRPDVASYYVNQGITFEKAGDLEAAIKSLETALQLEPQNYGTWYRIGLILRNSGNINKAEDAFSKARAIKVTSDVENALGSIYLKRSKVQEAEQFFKNAITLEPKNPVGHFNLGVVHQQKRDWAGAETELTRAIDADPSMFAAYYNLALAEKELGKKEKAQMLLKKYLTLLPPRLEQQRKDAEKLLSEL